jgi:hypothetical protein
MRSLIFFNLPNNSSHTSPLGFTQPLTEMSTRIRKRMFLRSKAWCERRYSSTSVYRAYSVSSNFFLFGYVKCMSYEGQNYWLTTFVNWRALYEHVTGIAQSIQWPGYGWRKGVRFSRDQIFFSFSPIQSANLGIKRPRREVDFPFSSVPKMN